MYVYLLVDEYFNREVTEMFGCLIQVSFSVEDRASFDPICGYEPLLTSLQIRIKQYVIVSVTVENEISSSSITLR
jgi:hypothetical protein